MSSPEVYETSETPTTLQDRTGRGSPGANQGSAEEFPTAQSQGQAETPGAADPQGPTRGAALTGGGPGDAAQVPVLSDQAEPGTSEQLAPVAGVHVPEVDESAATRR